MPPIKVPKAMPTMAGWPNRGEDQARLTPPTMEPRLKKLEAMAGMKKRAPGIQNAHDHGGQGDEDQKGEHDHGQLPVSSVLPAT